MEQIADGIPDPGTLALLQVGFKESLKNLKEASSGVEKIFKTGRALSNKNFGARKPKQDKVMLSKVASGAGKNSDAGTVQDVSEAEFAQIAEKMGYVKVP